MPHRCRTRSIPGARWSRGAAIALAVGATASAGTPAAGTPHVCFVPLQDERCATLREDLERALGAEGTQHDVPFHDPVSGRTGFACATVLTGTGTDFGSFLDAASRAAGVLEARGWREDHRYLAGGPTGTAVGMRRGSAVALLSVGWTPDDEARCADGLPIFACDVAPEHQAFTIVLTAARSERGPTTIETLPAALSEGRALAQARDLDLADVRLVSGTARSWPVTCLGLPVADEECEEVLVRGYEVVLEADGREHVFRTDALGGDVRRADER